MCLRISKPCDPKRERTCRKNENWWRERRNREPVWTLFTCHFICSTEICFCGTRSSMKLQEFRSDLIRPGASFMCTHSVVVKPRENSFQTDCVFFCVRVFIFLPHLILCTIPINALWSKVSWRGNWFLKNRHTIPNCTSNQRLSVPDDVHVVFQNEMIQANPSFFLSLGHKMCATGVLSF